MTEIGRTAIVLFRSGTKGEEESARGVDPAAGPAAEQRSASQDGAGDGGGGLAAPAASRLPAAAWRPRGGSVCAGRQPPAGHHWGLRRAA